MKGLHLFLWRALLFTTILCVWEISAGRLISEFYVSRPTAIIWRLGDFFLSGEIFPHLAATLSEVLVGFVVGLPIGLLCGLMLGSFEMLERVFQPYIILLYSLPLLALAPLLILWFGVGATFKIVLVAVSVFFFIFFATFGGAKTLDLDLVATIRVMGASWPEVFSKVTLPASVNWIFTGVRIAAPYALTAAIVGEMLVARAGLGQLVIRSIQMNDIAGLYAILFVIMILGVLASEAADGLERVILRKQGQESQPVHV